MTSLKSEVPFYCKEEVRRTKVDDPKGTYVRKGECKKKNHFHHQ